MSRVMSADENESSPASAPRPLRVLLWRMRTMEVKASPARMPVSWAWNPAVLLRSKQSRVLQAVSSMTMPLAPNSSADGSPWPGSTTSLFTVPWSANKA
jgi:hypothetical protein